MVKKEMIGCCMHKGKGAGMIVLGLLIIGNAYWQVLDWGLFVGAVIILAGVMKLIMPMKKHRK